MAFNFKGRSYNRITWLLDAGHGENTKGKRSPVWDDGTQLLEWSFNRTLANKAQNIAKGDRDTFHRKPDDVTIVLLVHESEDISLSERAKRANVYQKNHPTELCIFLSVHGDAYTSDTAHGTTIFTSPGYTPTDNIATVFMGGMQREVESPNKRTRDAAIIKTKAPSDPFSLLKPHTWRFRGAKDAKFSVLMRTTMPAMLLETGFYTNYIECKYMMSAKGQGQIARAMVEGMKVVQLHLQTP